MESKQKEFKSSSKHYLSQKTWRFLRHILPLSFWNYLYSLRQLFLLNKLESLIHKRFISLEKEEHTKTHSSKKYQELIKSHSQDFMTDIEILKNLFNQFESDKEQLHNYNYLYAVLFKEIKETAKKVMEIGTYKGASLRSWKAYFTSAEIYGIDIDPATIFSESRIHTMLADQNSMDSLYNVNRQWSQEYDVIIDDGWHQPEASIFTMLAFIPQLAKGGIYILEDIDQSKYSKFYQKISDVFNGFENYYSEYIDLPKLVPNTGFNYNYGLLLIIKK
jgi:spermidine synthase